MAQAKEDARGASLGVVSKRDEVAYRVASLYLDAERAARIAKFWAAEAGARIAGTAQHVHGGIGIDTTYPLHRYFLWAKHHELTLGSAAQQLAHLGSTYPEGRL